MGSGGAGGGDFEGLRSGGRRVVGYQKCLSAGMSRVLGFGIVFGVMMVDDRGW